MKKNNFKQFGVFIFTLLTLVAVGVYADSWSEPSANAPSVSVPVPIHEGFDQVKQAGLAVNKFIAYQNAYFAQDLAIKGIIRAGTALDTNSTIKIGGLATNGTNYTVSVEQNGKFGATGVITDNGVVNALASAATNHLCVDTTGKIITCDDTSNGGGGECPAGEVYNPYLEGGGACYPYTVSITSPYPGMKISDVTGIPGFTYDKTNIVGSTSEGYALKQEGIHDETTGVTTLKVIIAGPTIAGGPYTEGNLSISKSGVTIKCIAIPKNSASTTYSIQMSSYVPADTISVAGNLGGC